MGGGCGGAAGGRHEGLVTAQRLVVVVCGSALAVTGQTKATKTPPWHVVVSCVCVCGGGGLWVAVGLRGCKVAWLSMVVSCVGRRRESEKRETLRRENSLDCKVWKDVYGQHMPTIGRREHYERTAEEVWLYGRYRCQCRAEMMRTTK